mmetsp:Transcript_29695/g.74526  ORF Transcript_29695/g.74526 Transcript_29695/m.74526 type:complete len:270 (+) Transcript_29695:526-1335(+)
MLAGQRKGAHHDAPQHLRAEALRTAGRDGGLVGRELAVRVGAALSLVPKAQAVVSRQVGGGFGGREDVVGAQRGGRMWQRHQLHGGATRSQRLGAGCQRPAHSGAQPRHVVLPRDAHTQVAQRLWLAQRHTCDPREPGLQVQRVQQRGQVGARGHGGRVHRVLPLQRRQHDGGVLYAAGEDAGAVKRGAVRHEAVAGQPAVGGLHAHHAAVGGRQPHRAPCVRAESRKAHAARHSSGAPTAAAARHPWLSHLRRHPGVEAVPPGAIGVG